MLCQSAIENQLAESNQAVRRVSQELAKQNEQIKIEQEAGVIKLGLQAQGIKCRLQAAGNHCLQLSGTSATISSLKAEVTKAKDKMNEDRKMFEKRLLTLTVCSWPGAVPN